MNKKFIVLISAICVIGIILLLLWPHISGDISNVNRTVMQSELYSKKDITDAMQIVENKFKSDFNDCTLSDLWYDEDISQSSSEKWAEQYNSDEAIVLLSNFKVGSFGGDGSLNPGDTYKNWQWILVRDKDSDKWKLETWGY